MDVLELMRSRRSVRAFKDEPISRELLQEILADASRAPSAINMQPWEVHLVLDQEKARLSKRLIKAFKERGLTCGPGATQTLESKFMDRARECADSMNPLIEKMGSDFKTYVNEGSLNFYGAPAAALIFIDDSFPKDRLVDIGSFMAYLVISAAGHGLGSCPIGLVKSYEDEIKGVLNIPESKNLVISVALGRPDPSAPVNEFKSSRAQLHEFLRWIC